MLHHISIPAAEPERVARVLAEILGTNQIVPFPEHTNSYIALALDEFGTFVEIYPSTTALQPGLEEQPVSFGSVPPSCGNFAFHANISVPVDEETILKVAHREGWRAVRANRHINDVIELWVENNLMIELMPPDFAKTYLDFMQPENLARVAGQARQVAEEGQ